ncbi:Ankyrin-3 [Arthrobotrys entomopaga]|nr:Ankyrin-3 [Arthrobotrys entomopaga]
MSSDWVPASAESFVHIPYKIADDDSLQLSRLSISQQTPDQSSDDQSLCKTLDDFNRGAYLELYSTKNLITFLICLGLKGPLEYSEHMSDGNKFIGEGGQFSVRECTLLIPPDMENPVPCVQKAIVKRPKWLIDGSESSSFDLTKEEYAQRVHDIALEVLALCHQDLSWHRNIVCLLGWSYDTAWHKAPVLIFERALCNLEVFSKHDNTYQHAMVRYHFCLDIAQGLFAIHTAGIAHGDLKPSNILIFKETESTEVCYVARLADFGLSVDENMTTSAQKRILRGWTPGWIAPEIEECSKRRDSVAGIDFRAADRYSLGLVIWSLLLLGGRVPRIDSTDKPASTVLHDLTNPTEPLGLESEIITTLTDIVPKLLSDDPLSRPENFVDGFYNNSEYYSLWAELNWPQTDELEWDILATGEYKHSWYLEPVKGFMQSASMEDTITLVGESLKPQQNLPLFLALTKRYDLNILERRQNFVDRLLPHFNFQALDKDFPPAQGISMQLYNRFGTDFLKSVSAEEEKCLLLNVAVTGSLPAFAHLRATDEEMHNTARKYFRSLGGYNQLYSHRGSVRRRKVFTIDTFHGLLDAVKSERWQALQGLKDAFYGPAIQDTCTIDHTSELDIFHETILLCDYTAARRALEKTSTLLNGQDCQGFTALYKACMLGDYAMVKLLCDHGADATVRENSKQPTCLHWLFNFDDEYVQAVANLLVAQGAKVDTVLEREYVNYHYPFTWPRGTALHWSIWARKKSAVKALLLLGASISLRDGSDPHRFDVLVRALFLDSVGTERDTTRYQKSDECLFGMNALDLAFSVLDADILSLLMRDADQSQIIFSAGDEEGFTPIHRISRLLMSTFNIEFDASFFRKPEERYHLARECIRVWKEMGQDINLLTNLKWPQFSNIPNYTPIVLSVLRGDVPVVSAFLEEGADVDTEDSEGLLYTVLHAGPKGELLQTLLRHGVDVNAPSRAGWTPLCIYAKSKDFRAVFDLLDAGADPELRTGGCHFLSWILDPRPIQSLHLLGVSNITEWRYDYEEKAIKCIVRTLDKAQAENPEASLAEILQNLDGMETSALHFAAASGLAKVIRELLRLNLSPHRVCKPFEEQHNGFEIKSHDLPYLKLSASPLGFARVYREIFLARFVQSTEISKSDLRFCLSQWDECIDVLQKHGATV